jgi:hypothetical protein
VDFSACISREGNQQERWYSLLPDLRHQESMSVDRGIGPFRLGEARQTVLSLLGPPQERVPALNVYRPWLTQDFSTGGPELIFGVGYDHLGHVVSLLNNWNRLTINGHPISDQTPLDQSELTSQLKSWSRVSCGKVSGLTNHLLHDHASRSVIWMTPEVPTVSVLGRGQAICSPAVARLIG